LRPLSSKEPKKEKKTAGESSAATAAQDGNSDSKKVTKEEDSRMLVEGQTSRILPKTPPAADGIMNPGNYIPKYLIVLVVFRNLIPMLCYTFMSSINSL
jgi:hypothetical protein